MIFALCGGDGRQARLAGLLLADGHKVRTWALERAELPDGARPCQSAAEALEGADCLLLPMPVSAKSGLLNAPLSGEGHCLGEVFAAAAPDMLVCGGMPGAEARAVASGRGLRLHDYGAREELLAANAVATAEGAIGVLLGETERTLWRSRVLVTGWGHVARALAPRLAALGAEVLAAADGTVASVTTDPVTGTTLTLSHSGGMTTVYGNLDPDTVSAAVGDAVTAGQALACVGPSASGEGSGESAFLHFAVTVDGQSVDPQQYLS